MKYRRWFAVLAVSLAVAYLVKEIIINLVILAVILEPPQVFEKDFVQDWLSARAILDGLNPYISTNDLAARYIGSFRIFPHPTPHPPTLLIAVAPLGLFDYQTAAIAWMIIEVVCLLGTARILAGRWSYALALFCVFLAWKPVMEELMRGQLMALILLLLAAAWRALRSDRDISGGAFLGLAIAFKLIAWPLLVFLALKRRWRACASCLSVVAGCHLVAAAVCGFGCVINYYSKVGAGVLPFYRGYLTNFSLHALAWRMFDGAGSTAFKVTSAPPLIHAPTVAEAVSAIAPLALVLVALALALRARDLDAGFSVVICACVIASPIAWLMYALLLVIPAAILFLKLQATGFPIRKTAFASIFFVGLWLMHYPEQVIQPAYAIKHSPPGGPYSVSFPIAMLSFAPLVITFALMALVIYVSPRKSITGRSPDQSLDPTTQGNVQNALHGF
ncbi:MAG: glycosyltransferase family 87 protein [Blastocatellales bacterium]